MLGLARGRYSRVLRSRTQAFFFAVRAFGFLVKALAGFVAEPVAVDDFLEDSREAALCGALREIGGDVSQDVDADHVGEAEGAGAGPADGGAGEGVGFLDGEALLKHERGGGEHDGYADAVGDEVGRVIGEDNLLAEEAIGECGKGGEQRGIGFGDGDELEEAHVARRIEEMAAEKPAAYSFRKCRGDLGDGQAGGVGGEQACWGRDAGRLAPEARALWRDFRPRLQ